MDALIVYTPGETGVRLRQRYYRRRLRRCGENFVVRTGVQLSGLDQIEVGDDVTLRETRLFRQVSRCHRVKSGGA